MNVRKPDEHRLFYAAKTAIALVSLAYETLWEVYPDELFMLKEHNQKEVIAALKKAIGTVAEASPLARGSPELDDIF